NPDGPVDHDVPVLKVTAADGKLKAALFGYACHNTTLGGGMYKFHGDYAGYAQEDLERANPGATAMFLALCGGNQNPRPHGTLAMAKDHGAELAAAVDKVLSGRAKSVRGPLRPAWETVALKLKPRSREELQELAKSDNPLRVRYARSMLESYDDRIK